MDDDERDTSDLYVSSAVRQSTGTIRTLVQARGFGFLVDTEGVSRFFHKSACDSPPFEWLYEGDVVYFTPEEAVPSSKAGPSNTPHAKGRGPRATAIRKLRV